MKRILITGAGSFIGTSFEQYAAQWPERYQVDTIDMQDDSWRESSFAGYDAVFHVAGLAHSDTGSLSEERKALYRKVNTELTIETAQKARRDHVKQFIFMSSIIVYGGSAPIGQKRRITPSTPVGPVNFYGESKLKAEEGLRPLEDGSFRVCILRPPMVYGAGSKGNYPVLARLARRLAVFPHVENERSMLYVENLMEFVRLMIENEESGIFFPQNAAYVNTSEMVREIASAHGRRTLLVRGFGWSLKLAAHLTALVNKAFGSLSYDQSMSRYKEDYQVCGFAESIRRTEAAGGGQDT